MKQQHVKWHCIPAKAVLHTFKTDAACGLSRKAARSRLRKKGENAIFLPNRKNGLLGSYSLFAAPLWWMLLALCVMSLMLSFSPSVLFALVLLLIPMVFYIKMSLEQQKMYRHIDRLWLPMVSVLRDGGEILLAALYVVEGDILLLKKGDVVPCECRILTPEPISVLEPIEGADGKRRYQQMEKDGSFLYPYGSPMPSFACSNMLIPHTEILRGSARVVVTHVPTAEEQLPYLQANSKTAERKENGIFESFLPYLKLIQMGGVIVCVLIAVIGLLLQGEGSFLSSSFLPASAFAFSASASIGMLCLKHPLFLERNAALFDKNGCSAIRYTASVQRASNITDVVVTDLSALTDGVLHPNTVFCDGKFFELPDSEDQSLVHPICEAALLFDTVGKKESNGLDRLWMRELTESTAFDGEALHLRVLSCTENPTGHPHIRSLQVKTHTDEYELLQANGSFLLRRCVHCRQGERLLLLDKKTKEQLATLCFETQKKGGKALLYYRKCKENLALIGGLFLLPKPVAELKALPTRFQEMGIRLSLLLPPEDSWDLSLTLPWRGTMIPSDMPYSEVLAALDANRIVFGADENQIKGWLSQLHAQKRRVCLVGDRFSSLLQSHSADLSVSCTSLFDRGAWMQNGQTKEHLCGKITPMPRLLRHTDMLVKCAPDAEGLRGLCNGILHCRKALIRMQGLFLSWFSMHLLLLFSMLGSLLTGASLPTASHLLLLSPVLLCLTAFWASFLPVSSALLSRPCRLTKEGIFGRLFSTALALPPIVSGLLASALISAFGHLLDMSAVEQRTALFCSMLGMLLLLILRVLHKSGFQLTFFNTWQFVLTVLLLFTLLFFFSAWLPEVSNVTELGVWTPFTVVCAIASPFLYWAVDIFFGSILKRTAK